MTTHKDHFSEKHHDQAAAVLMIPVDLIDTAPQVRTKFPEASLRELAADIADRGLMQPVTVEPQGDRYMLRIGERRLRAVRLAGGTRIAAIVATVTPSDLLDVQLAENLQREALSAPDTVAAVVKMWHESKSLADVANRCGKSKAWVSKRLQIGMKAGPLTLELLESPKGTDTELVYYFAKLEAADYAAALDMLPNIINGALGKIDIKEAIIAATAEALEDGKPQDDQDPDPTEPTPPTPCAGPIKSSIELRSALFHITRIVEDALRVESLWNPRAVVTLYADVLRTVLETAQDATERQKPDQADQADQVQTQD